MFLYKKDELELRDMNTDDLFNGYEPDLRSAFEATAEEEFQKFLMDPMEITYRLDSIDEKRGFHYFLDIDKAAYIHDLGRREKYVAVYLAFITEDEEGRKSYSFDLVTPFGLNNYLSYIGANENANTINRIATFIQFRNLRTNQELEEKCYYLLKLNSVDKEKNVEQTAIYISVYDFGDLKAGDAAIPVLRPLKGLKGLVYKGKALPSPIIPAFPNGIMRLQVNNVGQGNWNEIQTRKKTRLVYDIGTYKEKKSRDDYVDKLINSHRYTRKPSLIISHWDVDHYNVLLLMTPKEREQFSQLIVTSTLPSLTPFKLLQNMVMNTKVKVSLVDNNPKVLTAPVNYINVINPQLKLFACPMKIGASKFYTNESGLLLDVDAKDKNILLTGDCTYDQASDAARQSFVTISQEKDHYLVVPHHGGGNKPNYQLPNHCSLKAVALSVDEYIRDKKGNLVRNRNGHPTMEVVCHFIKTHSCKLLRTDYANEDIIIR